MERRGHVRCLLRFPQSEVRVGGTKKVAIQWDKQSDSGYMLEMVLTGLAC